MILGVYGMYASDSSVREGFSRAKQDIESLRQENQELRAMILELKGQLGQPEAIASEPQSIVGGDIKAALKEALAEMAAHERKTPAVLISDDSISRFDLDKKAIIKAKILETVEHAPVMLPRLKEIVVDQNRYCSKASFYRYFDELKRDEKVSIVEMNGRTIVRSNRIQVYTT